MSFAAFAGLGHVLSHISVVELTHMVAGPACGQILADLGARVTKIEPPRGDVTRSIGPAIGGVSALFQSANRGKTSLAMDLRQPEEALKAKRLIAQADVVICNIDAGMVRRAGLDAQSLRAERPELIYVDITGFGPGEPSGTDGLAQANMGLMSVTGPTDGASYRTGASVVDVSTAVWAALGVVASVLERDRTLVGTHVETSLGDVCLYMQLPHLMMHAADPAVVRRNGNHSMVSCTPMLEAADGRVMVTLLHDRHWQIFCDVVEARIDLRTDPRFGDAQLRSLNQAALEVAFSPLFSTGRRDDWVMQLSQKGVPCAAERSYDEVLADDRLWRTGAFQHYEGQLQLGLPLVANGQRAGRPSSVATLRPDSARGGIEASAST